MNKRDLLKLPFAALVTNMFGSTGASSLETGKINQDGVTFAWRHEEQMLLGMLKAPTRGWIAAGFNDSGELKHTRFIIAAVSATPIRVEEHVAIVPRHLPVSDLGLPAALIRAEGSFAAGKSTLNFAMAHKIPGRPKLDLAPGNTVNAMLAWSSESDFDHHSAWRKQFTITL